MAYYLIKARAIPGKVIDLKRRLDHGEIFPMRPFGQALDFSLRNARQTPDGWIVWEEEDYCQPPLAMERDAVLDHYFTDLIVVLVEKGEGWQQIENLPYYWMGSTS